MSESRTVVIGVNYNSDEAALKFVTSVRKSSSSQDVTVILVDNTDREDSSKFFGRIWNEWPGVRCVKPSKNLGYLGGAHFGLTEYLKSSDYPDWIIVSNVDIEFKDSSFFEYLHNVDPSVNNIGVIAPSIWGELYRRDRNPHMLERVTYSQIEFYKKLYRFYPLTVIYFVAARIKYALKSRVFPKNIRLGRQTDLRSSTGSKSSEMMFVYAPQGSCMIFSQNYFLKGGTLNYPSFLFQEEIFVAEESRKAALKVVYEPRLQVSHKEHVSTGYVLSPQMARYFYESTVKIAELYYSKQEVTTSKHIKTL